MLDSNELQEGLKGFYGTEQWYRSPFLSFLYTDGVKFFVENAEAYWVLSEIDMLLHKVPEDSFYSVELLVKNSAAVLTIDDGNGKILQSRTITFTDCPEGLWRFFLEGPEGERVLLLPGEH